MAREFYQSRHSTSNKNPVIQKPSGFLRSSLGVGDLIRTHTVLAIDEHPHRAEPLVQAQRGILENAIHLD